MIRPDFVTSFDLSVELKDLGVKKPTQFIWNGTDESGWIVNDSNHPFGYVEAKEVNAYSSDELSKILANQNIIFGWNETFFARLIIPTNGTKKTPRKLFPGKTLAEAMGRMLVYLVKNKMIDPVQYS